MEGGRREAPPGLPGKGPLVVQQLRWVLWVFVFCFFFSLLLTETQGNVPATRPAKPHTRSGPTARIPGRFGDERGRAAAHRQRVRAAAPAAGREGARGAAAPGRARRCLRGRPGGKSLAGGRGDRAAPRPHRAAGGRAPAPGYREQPEHLERSEAAASPRAGKEPALLPPPARCPRGGSERIARPRETQTEAGDRENPEHGGKGKRDSRSRLGPPAGFGGQKKRAVGRGAG
ncbi:translation initiation factor IF-2-like isoform X2 [Cygnus atratus]|uniref:translation initiation factor IF-2-like isoform X2 n=1 Tax=Cygnus atratus TaxID=8868 RepID=UPI0021B79ACD|nr:translation initiation factor IF-2-like isoform X2 [Cygnus atratus]